MELDNESKMKGLAMNLARNLELDKKDVHETICSIAYLYSFVINSYVRSLPTEHRKDENSFIESQNKIINILVDSIRGGLQYYVSNFPPANEII